MGQGLSFDLTQEEIEDLQKGCNFKFSQTDIQVLYKRFLKLDKDKKGFISNEEFLSIPEFKLNPLAQRLVTIFENVNFKDFLHLLSAFSPKAAKEDKLKFMFNFHDVDGDGYISRLDLEHIMRQVRTTTQWTLKKRKEEKIEEKIARSSPLVFSNTLDVHFFFSSWGVALKRVGASLNESEMDKILSKVLEESGSKQERLDFQSFSKCFVEHEDFSLDVDIPSDNDDM